MKIDPYKHKERYLAWKKGAKEGISGVSIANNDLIMKFLADMEVGANIARGSSKGSRSFIRLNTLRDKLCYFSKKFDELYGIKDITEIKEEQLINFFASMKNGNIKKIDGGVYTSVDTYAGVFKTFWHWHQKTNKKKGIEIAEITTDLDTKQEKPKWVYLTEEQVKFLAENSKFEYKVLIYFLFDTGIRAPTELLNIKVSDFFNDFKELNIRQEVSKTFGRRIKLMICSSLIKDYVKSEKLTSEDYLFRSIPRIINQYLKRLGEKLLGNKMSPAGAKYSELTMYDFRHCACCYWLPRYKSESALKYRFGWKKSDKIHYYSELLGMSDTINEEDMLVDVTKTDLEKRLEKSEKEKEIIQERMKTMEMQMAKILELTKQLGMEVK